MDTGDGSLCSLGFMNTENRPLYPSPCTHVPFFYSLFSISSITVSKALMRA